MKKAKKIFFIFFSFLICVFLLIILLSYLWYLQKNHPKNFRQKRQPKIIKKNDEIPLHSIQVINMDKDADRLRLFKKNWSSLFKQIHRFPAVKIKQRVPHIGCTTSHLICVINFFEKNKDDNIVIVLEDDSIPFKGLTTNDLNEYLNILKEKWYLFEIANMSPMSWNFNFQSKNKSIKWKHAPDHYSFVYDCDGICFGNFLVYSRNSVSILKDIYENFITEEIQIPIVIDRIWNLSYGGYKLPFLRMLVPNSTFAYQNDSFSNNENKLVNFASKKILNQIAHLRPFWPFIFIKGDKKAIKY